MDSSSLAYIGPAVTITIAVLTPILAARYVAGRMSAQHEMMMKEIVRLDGDTKAMMARLEPLTVRLGNLETLQQVTSLNCRDRHSEDRHIPERLARIESKLDQLKESQASAALNIENRLSSAEDHRAELSKRVEAMSARIDAR